ncbi:VOC family protein [Streptomyces sp. NBC_00083]|uniref:VOC family protein n=1 Tax=Streptomyces sp. NBC_00083 TaxID=2975647 RepID=UPI00224E7975|nr:VOC family protein [Streptomyces sp. NBC_00083]MCX5387451.1 VOC family protein [Streptomyces sp. NBC_00083]
MPEVTSPYATGTPCWVDLMAKDQQAALDFYRDLFGWQGKPGPAEFGGYAVCELHGRAVAGIGPTMAAEGMPEAPTVWTNYLASTDAQATQEAIVSAGGTLMVPTMDVGNLGRMLVAADPQGAVFGIWQPGEFFGAQVVNETGALVWNELHTSDVPAATAFYGEAFGIEIEPLDGADSYWEMRVGGRAVGGVTLLDNDPPGTPAHWLAYFAVDDTDSTLDTLVKRGGTVIAPAFDMMAGRMAVVADPQGAPFAMIKPQPLA